IQRKFLGRSRFAQPLHVVLNKNLDDFTVDAAPALERPPGAAAGGHVRAELHCSTLHDGKFPKCDLLWPQIPRTGQPWFGFRNSVFGFEFPYIPPAASAARAMPNGPRSSRAPAPINSKSVQVIKN